MTVRRRPVSRDSRRRCFLASRRVEPLTEVTRLLTGASAMRTRRADAGHGVGRIVVSPAGQFQVLVTAATAATAARGHAVLERRPRSLRRPLRRCLRTSVSDSADVRVRPRRPRLRRRRRLPASSSSSPSSSSASAAAAATGAGRTTVLRSGAWKITEVRAPGSMNSDAAGLSSGWSSGSSDCAAAGGLPRVRPAPSRLRSVGASVGGCCFGGCLGRDCCCAVASSAFGAALARLARRRTGFSATAVSAAASSVQPAGASATAGALASGSSAKAGSGSGAATGLRARVRRAGAFAASGGSFSFGASGGCFARLLCGDGGRAHPSRPRRPGPRLQPQPPRPPRRRPSATGALRRVRTALFGATGASASAVPAVSCVSSATTSSSLPATTWSLSICGDTPAPDAPPHSAPVGANMRQHPQALTEVNWIPSGSHRQWGAAALEGRRDCFGTR